MNKDFKKIYNEIISDEQNKEMTLKGYEPLYTANQNSKIVIIGQAPGIKAQTSQQPWKDKSGQVLREWLGVTDDEFYNQDLFALIPMDFYYPGKAKHGDLPPRKDFAAKWHPKLFNLMPNIKLYVLVGSYSQKYYLTGNKSNLTETVRSYKQFLPKYLPLIHPSPLNFRWHIKNPWFKSDVVPEINEYIRKFISE